MSIMGKGNSWGAQPANDTTKIGNETGGRFDRGRKNRRASRMALPLGVALLRAACWAMGREEEASAAGKDVAVCCRAFACQICIFATSF